MEYNETAKNISRLNAKVYELMFLLYDQMAEIKEQLDLLIKSGKTTARTSFLFRWIIFAA